MNLTQETWTKEKKKYTMTVETIVDGVKHKTIVIKYAYSKKEAEESIKVEVKITHF
jgi:hypothetical protein